MSRPRIGPSGWATPIPLTDGFLLDQRGINGHVAFLNITYEEYSRRGKTPEANELMGMIIDSDPITEMYQCGSLSQYADPENELNAIINDGRLSTCRKIK